LITTSLSSFRKHFKNAYLGGLRRKLGLQEAKPDDGALALDLLPRMSANKADYTLTFRRLCDAAEDPAADRDVAALFADPSSLTGFADKWRARLASESISGELRARGMRRVNPAFIPRNHRIEAAIEAAETRNDFGPFERLCVVLERPFEDQPEARDLIQPAAPEELIMRTFCGT
jgi:uncharacterized protein YdiU (UPF0061 family)